MTNKRTTLAWTLFWSAFSAIVGVAGGILAVGSPAPAPTVNQKPAAVVAPLVQTTPETPADTPPATTTEQPVTTSEQPAPTATTDEPTSPPATTTVVTLPPTDPNPNNPPPGAAPIITTTPASAPTTGADVIE